MKKFIYKILCALTLPLGGVGGGLLTSCLHDDEEVFDKSAAERIQEAVTTDRKLLESSENGWEMTLWTGTSYSGGGYTMFMTFKDGKVRIQSDIAPETLVCQSSYDIKKDQGPVLTFNTYNPILHYMAEPSAYALSGNEGDYEFVIQRATQDSIFLKGKKYGNKTVMTRVKAGTDISAYIQKMQSNLRSIGGYFADGNDTIIVDPSARRVYKSKTGNGVAYAPTDKGISLLTPIYIKGKRYSEFTWDAATKSIATSDAKFASVQPEGYMSIKDWEGAWNLRYVNPSTSNYDQFRLTLEPTEELIGQQAMGALTGKFMIDEYTFELIVYYSPLTGMISIPAQYIADPTGTYGMFLLLGCDAYGEELSWYAVDWNAKYDKEAGKYVLVGDNTNANGNDMNTIMMLAVNSNGELIGNSDGQAMSLLTLMFVDYLTR